MKWYHWKFPFWYSIKSSLLISELNTSKKSLRLMGSATANLSGKCALWHSLTQPSLPRLIWIVVPFFGNPKSHFAHNLLHYSIIFSLWRYAFSTWFLGFFFYWFLLMVRNTIPICRISVSSTVEAVPEKMKDKSASGFDLNSGFVLFYLVLLILCWFFFPSVFVGLQDYPKVKVKEEENLDDRPVVYEQKRSYLFSLKDLESLFLQDSSNTPGTL